MVLFYLFGDVPSTLLTLDVGLVAFGLIE